VLGLLGPSGMGKTTLFKILAGLDTPDAGQVLVGVGQKPVERGMVGVVAQNYPLFNHRTVLGNLAVAGRQAHMSGKRAEERANELLERFGMAEHGGKYPVQLSGGQRQRVAIAQQFMCSEHFLLMDEPFSGLDPMAVQRVINFINEMASTDELKTFIVVTHDIEAAMEVSDHIHLLGRDRDESGNVLPGAKIRASYDLGAMGLAWRDNVSAEPEFVKLRQEIGKVFPTL
jgi:NitT/TauT family transport system ATP-binding protein